MKVYTYQAALLCEDCGKTRQTTLTVQGRRPRGYPDETTYDSDQYPKGPFDAADADAPQHCDKCGLFLENALTPEGIEYVRAKLAEFDKALAMLRHSSSANTLDQWREFYGTALKEGV